MGEETIKKLTVISLLLIFLFVGCATVPKCPPENTIFMTPCGPMEMPKGFFDTEEGQEWMHSDDYKNAIKKQGGL